MLHFWLCGFFGFVAFLALWLFWLRDFFGFLAFLALWLLWLRDFFGFVAFSALWRIRVKLALFIPLKVDFNRLVLLMSIIYWLFSKTFVFWQIKLFLNSDQWRTRKLQQSQKKPVGFNVICLRKAKKASRFWSFVLRWEL